eukprot:7387226-Prymnesium_polylepis.5
MGHTFGQGAETVLPSRAARVVLIVEIYHHGQLRVGCTCGCDVGHEAPVDVGLSCARRLRRPQDSRRRGPVAVERRKAPVEAATLCRERRPELLWERRRRRGQHTRLPVAFLGRSALSYGARVRGRAGRERLVNSRERRREQRFVAAVAGVRGRTD